MKKFDVKYNTKSCDKCGQKLTEAKIKYVTSYTPTGGATQIKEFLKIYCNTCGFTFKMRCKNA